MNNINESAYVQTYCLSLSPDRLFLLNNCSVMNQDKISSKWCHGNLTNMGLRIKGYDK